MSKIVKDGHKLIINEEKYRVIIYHADIDLYEQDDNYDIEIILNNGKRYSGTVFTLVNINSIMNKDKQTGEMDCGLYFGGCKDMVIVELLTIDVIARVVRSVYKDSLIEKVFSLLA